MKYLVYLVMFVIAGHVMAQDLKKIPVQPQQKAAAPHKKARKHRKDSTHLSDAEKKRIANKQMNLERTLKEKKFHKPDSVKHK